VGSFDFKTHAREWIAAWNSHDLDRILAHYSEDVELISPFVIELTGQREGVVRGKSALGDYFARSLKAFPTLQFKLIRIYAGVRSCVLEYCSVNGLRTAELMEFDDEGKVRRVLAHYQGQSRADAVDPSHQTVTLAV
jgi:ketosteroid isomerase-like protein